MVRNIINLDFLYFRDHLAANRESQQVSFQVHFEWWGPREGYLGHCTENLKASHWLSRRVCNQLLLPVMARGGGAGRPTCHLFDFLIQSNPLNLQLGSLSLGIKSWNNWPKDRQILGCSLTCTLIVPVLSFYHCIPNADYLKSYSRCN